MPKMNRKNPFPASTRAKKPSTMGSRAKANAATTESNIRLSMRPTQGVNSKTVPNSR